VEAGIDYALSLLNKPLVNVPGSDNIGCGGSQGEFEGNMDNLCRRELTKNQYLNKFVGDAVNETVDWLFKTTPQLGANNHSVCYA
jgi:hypothetical protein